MRSRVPAPDARRRERELLARFRLRIARTASRIALIVVGAIAFYVIVEPPQGGTLARVLLWALLFIAAGVSGAIHHRSRSTAPPIPLWAFYAWTASVLAFDSAVVLLYGDPMSDIYLAYLLPVLFAAATLPVLAVALTLGGAVLSYVTVLLLLDGAIAHGDLVLRVAAFSVVGLLGSYLAREQQREIGVQVEQEQHLGALLIRAISAQEDERQRIARELHDGPVQALAMLSMQLAHVEELPPAEHPRIQRRVAEIRTTLRRTLDEVRLMIQNLRPSALDDLGLVAALRDFVSTQCDARGVKVRWQVSGAARELDPAVETAVFRILQEGVNNVVKHAHAGSVAVSLDFGDERLRGVVQDDGVGFDPRTVESSPDGHGVGLLGMRERAALLGGSLAIDSVPEKGTRLSVEVPLAGGTHG